MESAPMKGFRTPAPYVAALFGLVLVACGGESLPSGPPGAVSTVEPTPSAAPLYTCETPAFGSVSKVIGAEGGEITVGRHSLRIPGNALREDVTITATASAGQVVRIELQPHGLVFDRPAQLTLSYEHCATPPAKARYVAYVDDLGNVLELLDVNFHRSGKEVETQLKHFSGYAIAD
jgi:hypothetical protein